MVCLRFVCVSGQLISGKAGFSEMVLKVKTFLVAEGQLLDQEGLLSCSDPTEA